GGATALAVASDNALDRFATWEDVVALIRANRDGMLRYEVEKYIRLARYQPGRIEFTPTEDAPRDLAAKLAGRLQGWTGARWGVTVVGGATAPTIDETRNAERTALEAEARAHPLVKAVFAAFPKAKITEIRTLEEIEAEAQAEALPEIAEDEDDEDWDPFEDR
ncbi:MAG: DNA polymerase III subunit gamma/tau, partial [Maritimibacter sp.]|nr:DNA polymerase III subunit gamma/tau [Maritimibacter sp.]